MSDSHTQPHLILKIWCLILGLALLLTGLFFIVFGGKLISLGGSWYFLLAGLLIAASSIFIFKRKALGVALYALAFVATVIWAISDAGFDFWALHSRLMFPAGLFAAVLLTLPAIRKAQNQQNYAAIPAYALGGLTVLGMIGGLYGMFIPIQQLQLQVRLCR